MTTRPVQPDSKPGCQTGEGCTPPVLTSARDERALAVRSSVMAITPTHALVGTPAETLRLLAMIEEHQSKSRTALRAAGRSDSSSASDRPIHAPIHAPIAR